MLPTDPRLHSLSPFQEMWLMAQIQKRRQSEEARMFDNIKLVCSFIDPDRAKKVFTEGDRVEVSDDDFFAEMKAMDQNFDSAEYKEILVNM